MTTTDRTDPTEGRRLIAVVYADMVGYSRLIGLDDAGTLRRLHTLRRVLIDPAIREHGGRLVKTGGDSLLIAFDSLDGAVRCAVKVQQQVPVYDGDQALDRHIRFRVGINIGDAIVEGTDLHGDVVNIAARLQAQCPPGKICVTRAVRDHVHGRLDLTFEDLGALNLKNIDRPVEAFLLGAPIEDASPKAIDRSIQQGLSYALPIPDKPSVAVLAFTNMSGDIDQEYFSDGIAEDIITELSRNRSLFVIARNSSFTYKGRVVDVRQVAGELGVRYLLTGSVRRAGEQIRVSVQLIDAMAGDHIWAERYDRAVADVFAVQDEIAHSIVAAIDPAVSQAERRRALQQPSESLGAWEAYQRAMWHWSRMEVATSRQFLNRAVELNPHFAAAHAMLGWRYLTESTMGTDLTLNESVHLAEEKARKALELEPDNATAYATLAWVFFYQEDPASALEEADVALKLNPNDAQAHLIKGRILVFAGRMAEGRTSLAAASRLDPHGPTGPPTMIHNVISYYFEKDYSAAETMARRAIRSYPSHQMLAYRWLAAALGQLGRVQEGRAILDKIMRTWPGSFDFYVRARPPWFQHKDYEHMLDGLRRAGLSSSCADGATTASRP